MTHPLESEGDQQASARRAEWLLDGMPLGLPTAAAIALKLTDFPAVQTLVLRALPVSVFNLWRAWGALVWVAMVAGCSLWTAWRFTRANYADWRDVAFSLLFLTAVLGVSHSMARQVALAIIAVLTNDGRWLE